MSALLAQLSFVHNVLCLFNPLYPLMGCLNCITKVGLVHRAALRAALVSNFLFGATNITEAAPSERTDSATRPSPLAQQSPDFGFLSVCR